MSEPAELDQISRSVRFRLIEMSHRAQTAHLAGALSCVDLLVALYWTRLRADPAAPADPGRDRLIFSKGHAISALYTVLAMRGYFPEASLVDYNREGRACRSNRRRTAYRVWNGPRVRSAMGWGSGSASRSRRASRERRTGRL